MALSKPVPRAEAAAELEVMLARVREMQDAERSPDLRDSYRAVADRIGATLSRLRQPKPVVIGLKLKEPVAAPPPPAEPPKPVLSGRKLVPTPAPAQPALPLGPVAIAKPPTRKRR